MSASAALLASSAATPPRPIEAAARPASSEFLLPPAKSMGMSIGSAGGSGASLGSTRVSTPSSRLPRMPDTSIASPTVNESLKLSFVYDGEAGEEDEDAGVVVSEAGGAEAATADEVSEGAAVVSSGPEASEGDDGSGLFFDVRTDFFLTAVMVSVLVPPSSEICASTSSFLQPGRSAVKIAAPSVSTTSWGGVPAVGVGSESSRATAPRESWKMRGSGSTGAVWGGWRVLRVGLKLAAPKLPLGGWGWPVSNSFKSNRESNDISSQ